MNSVLYCAYSTRQSATRQLLWRDNLNFILRHSFNNYIGDSLATYLSLSIIMAIKATVYKAELQISDMDRHYYHGHTLTLAQHPSETLERMMIRLLVFAIHADENLEFTRGLSSDDEPDLWQKHDNGEIEVWIDLGQPDEKRLRKACGRANAVYIYTYSQRSASVWWQKIESKLSRFDNLHIIALADETCAALVQLVERSMRLQCSIQDAELWLGNEQTSVHIKPEIWK